MQILSNFKGTVSVILRMSATFLMTLSQVATSQGYFPKWELPKCAISQAATSQVCPSRSARPPVCPSRSARPAFQPATPQMA